MRFVKGISLFFIYPVIMLGIGFLGGIWAVQFFYPGAVQPNQSESGQYFNTTIENEAGESTQNMIETTDAELLPPDMEDDSFQQVAVVEETLNADTEYVVQERDLLRDTMVETVWQIPGKYIGMNRELFLASMEEYSLNPPLSEMERGFQGLEVLSFSPKRVVVQMNYEYVQPSESFYLAVRDHEVVVLLEDGSTIFINTGILLEDLPELVQMKIIQLYYIENEESLYNFLETYSS